MDCGWGRSYILETHETSCGGRFCCAKSVTEDAFMRIRNSYSISVAEPPNDVPLALKLGACGRS